MTEPYRKPSYWVLRVVLHNCRSVQLGMLDGESRIAAEAHIEAGKLALLPDCTLAEPVEVFGSIEDAHAHREVLRRRHPGEDFRVVMAVDV